MSAFERHLDLPPDINAALACPSDRKPLLRKRWISPLEFAYASTVIDQLYECKLIHPKSQSVGLVFNHDVGPGYESEIRLLGQILKLALCPLAIVGGSSGILLISDTKHVFLLGCHAPGVLYLGDDLGKSLQLLIATNVELPWLMIPFDLDPDHVFEPNNFPLEQGTLVIYVKRDEEFNPIAVGFP